MNVFDVIRIHFKPSKTTAFVLGSMYAAFLVLAFLLWNNLAFQLCSGPWWLWATLSIVFYVRWYRKYAHDKQLAEQASYERVYDMPHYGVAASPTTPGSSEITLDWDHPES